jgi:hypothetical protein
MSDDCPYEIPAEPPPDALAELDVAAGALLDLSRRGARLTLSLDERTRVARIELAEDDEVRAQTPTQLFALLGFI